MKVHFRFTRTTFITSFILEIEDTNMEVINLKRLLLDEMNKPNFFKYKVKKVKFYNNRDELSENTILKTLPLCFIDGEYSLLLYFEI